MLLLGIQKELNLKVGYIVHFTYRIQIMKLKYFIFVPFIGFLLCKQSFGHCQVPCGIYSDQLRFEQMLEDQSTIEKASKLIVELSTNSDAFSIQQLSRWVATKEAHASAIQKTICEYFLIQRIKNSAKDYEKQLKGAHAVLVSAMKCKQNTDADSCANLKSSILAFHKAYEGK